MQRWIWDYSLCAVQKSLPSDTATQGCCPGHSQLFLTHKFPVSHHFPTVAVDFFCQNLVHTSVRAPSCSQPEDQHQILILLRQSILFCPSPLSNLQWFPQPLSVPQCPLPMEQPLAAGTASTWEARHLLRWKTTPEWHFPPTFSFNLPVFGGVPSDFSTQGLGDAASSALPTGRKPCSQTPLQRGSGHLSAASEAVSPALITQI